ncbi:MAG: porin family protein [Pseudaminobacter sp.]|nr:porin family protein [Pseudaminobacter sp.]
MSIYARAFAVTVAVLVAAPAMAADLYEPPVVEVIEPVYGGWYIRGHIGMSNQDFDRLDSSLYDSAAILDYGWHDEGGFSSAPLFSAGVGYRYNDYLRGDLTVEYRGKSDFEALDYVTIAGPLTTTNDFRAKKSELLFMANAYADVGTFYGVTPYVGAGLGASYNTISHFRDINIINGGGGYADDESEWNLAWALHAGLGIEATERMTVDLGYSFVSLGDATTGTFHNDDPAFDIDNDGFQFNDLYSHDFKLGVRYALN